MRKSLPALAQALVAIFLVDLAPHLLPDEFWLEYDAWGSASDYTSMLKNGLAAPNTWATGANP